MFLSKTQRVGLHTYVGMIGYCVKDKGQQHFDVVHNNITQAELEVGIEEYMKYGTIFANNKVVLTSRILLERCLTYAHYEMKKQLGSQLPGVLLSMLWTGTYV